MDKYRLDLQAIEQSLRDVQREFPKINEVLHSRRDSMTDAVLDNMLAGYAFIDQALADGADLFTLRHIRDLLELNHGITNTKMSPRGSAPPACMSAF